MYFFTLIPLWYSIFYYTNKFKRGFNRLLFACDNNLTRYFFCKLLFSEAQQNVYDMLFIPFVNNFFCSGIFWCYAPNARDSS